MHMMSEGQEIHIDVRLAQGTNFFRCLSCIMMAHCFFPLAAEIYGDNALGANVEDFWVDCTHLELQVSPPTARGF